LSPIRNLSAKSVTFRIVLASLALALGVAPPAPVTASSALSATAAVRPAAELASAVTPAAESASVITARQTAKTMLHSYGWRLRQFRYLVQLWNSESSWNVYAQNPYSGAYGIPQAVPGSKMASAGPDWRTDAATQIRWGLGYIKQSYGSPRLAWLHEAADGWY